ncbi:6-phosphogluconate dehydrogenase [Infundibulicybe gibba]|nr:6-phosphogluconate dehydrogenase [Infundibulicybe gibba]
MNTNLPRTFGWVGLGAMGYPMAIQLRRKLPPTAEMFIFDLNEVILQHFISETAQFGRVYATESAREVAQQADCIISIVPEGSHVKAIFIDCSTIDITTSRSVGKSVNESHPANPPQFFDAPVSGGTAGAERGALTFMVGAAPDDPHCPMLQHLFSYMGTSIHFAGGPGLGLAAKLSNNYASGLIALATSEAMNLGMRLGLDPKVLSDILKTSSGGSWVNSNVNPVPGVCPNAVTSKGYEGGFKVQLMKKDMTLAVNAAREVDAKLVLGDAGLAAYSAASEDPRCRDKDSRVVYRWLGGIEPTLYPTISSPPERGSDGN